MCEVLRAKKIVFESLSKSPVSPLALDCGTGLHVLCLGPIKTVPEEMPFIYNLQRITYSLTNIHDEKVNFS